MEEKRNLNANFNCNDGGNLQLTPIGVLRNNRLSKFETPHQPIEDPEEWSIIELRQESSLVSALSDLEGFSHIWLLWWFHKSKQHWKPKVLPPRGKARRRGVFATRSPHRPNPIGLTAVRLLKVTRNTLYIGSNDLLDGTPILDIKPYLSKVDAVSETSNGWLAEVEAELERPAVYRVQMSDLAKAKISWLRQRDVRFIERATEILERDPSPHRTRRIVKLPNKKFRISCASWRMVFSVVAEQVFIEDVFSGHPQKSLQPSRASQISDFQIHLDYHNSWTR